MNNGYLSSRIVFTVIFSLIAVLLSSTIFAADPTYWIPSAPNLPQSTPEARILEETSDYLIIEWIVPGIFVIDIETGGEVFQEVTFGTEVYSSFSRPGEPLLPALTEIIHIPDNSTVSVTLVEAEWIYIDEFNLFPRQFPRRVGSSTPNGFIKNAEIYKSGKPLPENTVKIGRVQGWGGVAVAPLSVTPLRYYPTSRSLEIAKRMTVRVNFHPGRVLEIVKPHLLSRRMCELHQRTVLNPSLIVQRELDFDEPEPIRMLVVLKEEALETAQPLIDFHHNTGLRVEVLLADEIEDEEEIKDIVRDMYEDGLEYLFIIGDGYYRNPDVPMHYWSARDPGWQDPESTASHSDNWYICLDPPDEDGYEDHLPDLAVGRLVYDSDDEMEELEIQVDKLMDYIEYRFEDEEGEWLSRALLVGHRDFEEEEGGYLYINCKRAIEEFEYEFFAPEFTHLYGNENGATNSAVVEAVNDDGVGILNYRGHGSNNRWSSWSNRYESWTSANVRQLENRDMPFILISSACKCGNIATYDTEINSTCLLESFQKHDGGSVCAHGSVISTYTPGNTFFDQAVFRAWFDEGVYDIGYAATDAMTEMVLEWTNDYYACIGRMNTRAYIWLGDPALELRLSTPEEMTVRIPQLVPLGIDMFEAVITIDNEALEGARLCARSEEDEIYVVGESDEEGRAALNFDPPLDDEVQLTWTVYHRNGIIVSGDITAVEGTGSIEGTVTEMSEDVPIEGAVITIYLLNIEAVTDAEGRYRFEDLPATDYTLTVAAEGYISASSDVTVEDDSTETVDFALGFQSSPDDVQQMIPTEFSLGNPYPNPFNARTLIPVNIPAPGMLQVTVYDISGRRIVELESGKYNAGRHLIPLSGDNLPSGVYFIRMSYAGQYVISKVVLMR